MNDKGRKWQRMAITPENGRIRRNNDVLVSSYRRVLTPHSKANTAGNVDSPGFQAVEDIAHAHAKHS